MNEKIVINAKNMNIGKGNNNGIICMGDNNSNNVVVRNKKKKEKTEKSRTYEAASTKVSALDGKLFFSHSSKNKEEIKMLVEFVEDMGIPHDRIVCTSIPDYGVPGGQNIYNWLKTQIGNPNLRVIYLLSKEYYESVVCLNEMGAAWIVGARETIFLIDDFEFKDIKGCLDAAKVGTHLDGEVSEVKPRLTEFKDTLIKEFGLPEINESKWERKRDAFIERFQNRKTNI